MFCFSLFLLRPPLLGAPCLCRLLRILRWSQLERDDLRGWETAPPAHFQYLQYAHERYCQVIRIHLFLSIPILIKKKYMFFSSPIPVIAAVDGHAAAAGCQLVSMCDIVLATKRSQFSTPGASFGIFCSTPGESQLFVLNPF